MIIIIIIGTLLGAHAYIHIVELQEKEAQDGVLLPIPVAKGKAVIELVKPRALVPT